MAWLEKCLADPARILTLILHDGAPVGVLRFDRHGTTSAHEISILVDPSQHGRGIAAAALRLGKCLFRGAVLRAEVDPANTPSRALFDRAGFHPLDARRYEWSSERALAATEASP